MRIGRNKENPSSRFLKKLGHLACRGGLAGPLKTHQHPDGGRRGRKTKRSLLLSHKKTKLVTPPLNPLLARTHAAHHFLTQGLRLRPSKEVFYDLIMDIRFEQCE